MKKILIIRFSAMGDVILTTPVIRMLKKRFPEARVDFLVKEEYAPLLSANPHLHAVHRFPTHGGAEAKRRCLRAVRAEHYDAILDLQVSPRSRLYRTAAGAGKKVTYKTRRWPRFLLVHFRVKRYADDVPVPLRFLEAIRPWGVEDDGLGAELWIDGQAERTIEKYLKDLGWNGAKPLMVLAPGAGRETKKWPAERFAEVGSHFQDDYVVVLAGGPKDAEVCRSVALGMKMKPFVLAGALSLRKTAALISRSRLVLSNDTGLMHMAMALGISTVALFGPTHRLFGFFPFRGRSRVVEKDLSCRPCSYHGTATCPKGHFRCMKEITPEEVISAIRQLLENASR